MSNLRDLNRFKKDLDCEYVSHCRGCRAIAYAKIGDYMSKDPMCFKSLIKPSDLKDVSILKNEISKTNNN